MDTKIKGRALFILAVIAVCVLGLTWGTGFTGVPRNISQVRENLRNNIRLGLDLKGGTHLILQVHVDDAVKITTDTTVERLKDELRTRNIPYSDIQEPDSTHILIKGIPQEKSGDMQTLASEQLTDWDVARVAGDATARSLTLKVSAAATIRCSTGRSACCRRSRAPRSSPARRAASPCGPTRGCSSSRRKPTPST